MNWKPILVVATVFLAGGALMPAASLDPSVNKGKQGDVSKEDVRRAIAIFRRNPLDAHGEMTGPIILTFAKDSPDVEVAINEKTLPWFANKAVPNETSKVLLVAFVAGDVEAQLDSGKAKDDPVAGSEQVIATYRQLQKADPKLKVREVETLIDLQKQGKLAEHFKAE